MKNSRSKDERRTSNVENRVSPLLSVCCFLLSASLSSACVDAKPASECLPGGAVVYLEWSGAGPTGVAQATTPFGKWLADPDLSRLIDEVTRIIAIKVKQQAAAEGQVEIADAAMRVLSTLWRRPVAVEVLDVTLVEGRPSVRAVLAIDVGVDEAAALTQSIDRIAAVLELPRADDEDIRGHTFRRFDHPAVPAIRCGVVDGVCLLTIGESTTEDVLAAISGSAPTMHQDATLVAAMDTIGRKQRTTLSLLHIDIQAVLRKARQVFASTTGAPQPMLPPPVEAILEATSINRLRSVTGTWQIDHDGYRESWFLALPPVEGRPRWLNQEPLTDDDLMLVPKDATFAKLVNFRFSDLYDGLMHVVDSVGPLAQMPVANAIATAEGMMGLRIKQDILDLLDDGSAAYITPNNGGLLITGITILIEARNPDGLAELLARLTRHIDGEVGPGVVAVQEKRYKDHTICFASITGVPIPVAPAWCVHGRHVIIALYPQMVMHAIDHLSVRDRSNSLLANPDFARARKMLPERCSAIVYSDTKADMTDLYKVLLPLATAACGWARGQGVPIDAGMIPASSRLTEPLFGDVMGLSSGADGLLLTTHASLPVAAAAGATPMVAALGVSVLMPSLSRSREQAKKAVSLANTRAIVTACLIYASNHDGAFPPDLQKLVDEGAIGAKVMRSPRDDREHISYIYIPGLRNDSPPDTIVLYENPDIGGGSAVGFADGHAEWMETAELKRKLARQSERPQPKTQP